MRVFRRAVVARADRDLVGRIPVGAVELDAVHTGVIGRRRHEGFETQRIADRRQHCFAVAECDLDVDRAHRSNRQLQRVHVGHAMRSVDLAFEHDGLVVRHQRVAAVELCDDDARQIVVQYRGLDIAHDGMVEALVKAQHRVADDHRAVALGQGVVHRRHEDRVVHGRLRSVLGPMGRVEHEHDGALRDVHQHTVDHDVAVVVDRGIRDQQAVARAQVVGDVARVQVAVVGMLFLRRHGTRHGDIDLGGRCLGQVDLVAVGDAALAHRSEAVAQPATLVDDDLALIAARHAHVDAVGRPIVVGRVARADAVVDDAARAFDVTRDDFTGHVASHVDLVVAQAADHARDQARRRAEHVDGVVAFERIDLEHLDVLVGHGQACTEDALVSYHDVVSEFGAQDHELVEAVATVHRDRRIDVVFDLVVAGAGANLGLRRSREARRQFGPRDQLFGVDPVDLFAGGAGVDGRGQRERAHREQVIAIVAFQAHHGLVAVHSEFVVALSTLGQQGRRGTRTEPAARGGHGAVDALRRE